jgi:hypothetical protein
MTVLLALAALAPALPGASPVQAQTNDLTLAVVSARTEPNAPGGPVSAGDPIDAYQFLINIDNTGDPNQPRDAGCSPLDPDYPDSCDWPSIRSVPSSSPIYASGSEVDLNALTGLTLPDGKYLISVMAEGYKLGGAHFTVPLEEPGQVKVELQPHPLPPATLRVKVFEDISPTNGMFDAPAEHGLAGFRVIINDTVGQVSTDVFGNPLCTLYDGNGEPLPPGQQVGDACLISDDNGDVVVPNLGPLRYDVTVSAPDGEVWLETTTLEGGWSWDTWLQEGGTGLDNEFVVAGEPFPWTVFGFVSPCELGNTADRCPLNDTMSGASGGVSGNLIEASVYLPQQGGLPYVGDIWTGFNGVRVTGPVTDGWIAISDLQQGDTAVYVGPANPDGSFLVTGLPDGDYFVAWWDYNLHFILDWLQVTVSNGGVVDMGTPMLTGWFTKVEGYVFIDSNKNGKRDPGEPGKSDYLVVLKDRDNSEIDRMSIAATTDMNGYYVFEKAYPMGSWMVLEAYNDRYYTTGITYQVDNQTEATTVLGNGVDVGILPILGQPARLDWGIYPYEPGTNGGIVGSVFYDTTRNELDPQYQAVEPWAPGIPNLEMNLWAPVPCGTNSGAACDAAYKYELAADGSYAKGALLNSTITETWEQPGGCIARDANGDPLPWGAPDQEVLPTDGSGNQDPGKRCLEAPLMGTQIQSGFASLDGNWGFGGVWQYDEFGNVIVDDFGDPIEFPMGAGDYLVEVVIPTDALGKPMYQVVREEDINVFGGDQFVPAVPPPSCAGPLHTVDVAGVGADGADAVINPSFAEAGGSPYEGMQKPLCNVKLVNLASGKSIAPAFNLFTNVPIPGRWKGYIINDLTVSTNPQELNFGEKAGMANAPIGVYDFTNKLVTTMTSDPNGVYEILLPSTYTMNCPTPSGVCANVYYILGNDPGQPGALNPNYNPQFRTIGTSFEVYPGLLIPSDLAPTEIVPGVLAAGSQYATPPQCFIDAASPQLFNASPVVVDGSVDTPVVIGGDGFGDAVGQVLLDGFPLQVDDWINEQINLTIPTGAPYGAHQLEIITADGKQPVNSLTMHVLGSAPFPSTALLDNFDRANGGLGASWGGAGNTVGTYRIWHFSPDLTDGVVQVRGTGNTWWLPGQYGPDQEAFFTFVKIGTGATEQGLLLKVNGNPGSNAGTAVEVAYNGVSQNVVVRTKVAGQNLNQAATQVTFAASFAVGDQLGARVLSDGMVNVFKNGVLIGSVDISAGASPWPESLISGGGMIGVRFAGNFNGGRDARFDDFGGGNLVNPAYTPTVYEVGPGKTYSTIQPALDAAAASPDRDLVVVYPGLAEQWNPFGAYFENLIVYAPVKLQGVGPGGFRADGTYVPGTVLDGRGVAADTAYAEEWRVKLQSIPWSGVQAIYEGADIYIVAEDGEFESSFNAAIDGFTITGGDQQGFPNNLAPVDPTVKDEAAVQGGGIFANGYARYLQITNNVFQSNGGAYAGAIRLGTPHIPGDLGDAQNDFVRIAHNRILANGGTNLAGAIGLFNGSEAYEVAYNDICGNYSAEYGGGISHYGFSPNGSIHHNRIYFNRSYDEGGGIIIAGELQPDPSMLTPGAGPVDVFNNLIQSNLANDDGGGLRFLMAGNFTYNVYNNIIANNISTHEGGGVSLNDAPDVRVFNNTIMKNITTATAMTSNGQPAPAGLSTSKNSTLLQATLPVGAPLFSNPLLFNNIFWDNRAGTFTGASVANIGLPDDPNPIFNWDLGIQDTTIGLLSPTFSLLQTDFGANPDVSNIVGVDPMVAQIYDTSVMVAPWRGNPRFVDVLMVTALADANLLGDYHLTAGSAAIDAGTSIGAPGFDFDGDLRPLLGGFDIGADEAP